MDHPNLAETARQMRRREKLARTTLKGTAAGEKFTIYDLSMFSIISEKPGLTLGEIANLLETDVDEVYTRVNAWNGYVLTCKPHQTQKPLVAVHIASHWDHAMKSWLSLAN